MSRSQWFEMLNCASMVMSFFIIVFLGLYLYRETDARGGRWLKIWSHLPPSMGLAVAFLTFASGAFLRATTIWVWQRFFGAEHFGAAQQTGMLLAASITAIGGLCVIRSATKPSYGHWPWMFTLAMTIGFTWLMTLHWS